MNSKRRTTTRSSSTVDETRSAPRVESTGASILSGASSTSVLGGEIINSQRDHNRATFIINIGGSDSHTSRSTLAVSNPTTSGSIGELPHASISSLLRDSPCSSTSSASNQELNSLEEFSVSTDSGLGGSEPESSEVESPPTEGDLVEEESSNSIYERHMMLKRHGFPLWIPQPNTTLPHSYQRQGVSIGDVGIFTPDGAFDFLFNVCLPAGHPSNPDALPEGFVPLELKPTDVRKYHAHSSHSHLASPSVKRRDRATFECSGSDGAILAMPQGAYHEDLKNISKFRKYALIYAESWYVYAKGSCGEEIGNGQLHLVTGCDKTTSWGIATYSHLPSKRPEDKVSLLRFNPVNSERRGLHPSYAMCEWDYEGVAEAKFGPEEDELMDLGVAGSDRPRNQCTFIRSLTPAFGKDDWERLELKVESSVKDQASVRSPKSPFLSVSGAISSLLSCIGFLRGHSRGGSSKATDSTAPAQATAAHPAAYVIDVMLRKCPKAKVVVVHDSDWCSVIRDSDDDWTYTAQDLPHRIEVAFHIIEGKNGTVYLEEKTRPSQDLNTSSDVSVKLEVEDRKPGPSQFFDSFEISPSDMQVDSPQSERIADNGDGDIKPKKYHDSDEVGIWMALLLWLSDWMFKTTRRYNAVKGGELDRTQDSRDPKGFKWKKSEGGLLIEDQTRRRYETPLSPMATAVMSAASLNVFSWTNQDPRESVLFNSWGVVYRFRTVVNPGGQRVTTLWRTIRPNKEIQVAELGWALNGGLGRILIGKNTLPMSDLVRPDHKLIGARIFDGPDGLQYRWRHSAASPDILLEDANGIVVAFFRPTRQMRFQIGDVFGELHFIRTAGAGTVMHPPVMDMVTVTAMLFRFCSAWNF